MSKEGVFVTIGYDGTRLVEWLGGEARMAEPMGADVRQSVNGQLGRLEHAMKEVDEITASILTSLATSEMPVSVVERKVPEPHNAVEGIISNIWEAGKKMIEQTTT